MENTSKVNTKWILITIEDPAYLPGKTICDVMWMIKKIINFKFVILDDIEGAAHNGLMSYLQKKQNSILNLEDLLKDILKVIQFDWGDFFLFTSYPKNWNNPKGESYPYVIAQTDTTIRAVDDQYVYIYTPYEEILNTIENNYKIENIKKDKIENLDFPY